MMSLNADAPDTPPFNWFRPIEAQDETGFRNQSFVEVALPQIQLIRDAQPADTPWVSHFYWNGQDYICRLLCSLTFIDPATTTAA